MREGEAIGVRRRWRRQRARPRSKVERTGEFRGRSETLRFITTQLHTTELQMQILRLRKRRAAQDDTSGARSALGSGTQCGASLGQGKPCPYEMRNGPPFAESAQDGSPARTKMGVRRKRQQLTTRACLRRADKKAARWEEVEQLLGGCAQV